MDKNDFDIDFDFEKEYGFNPKDFLSSDDDFDYSEFDASKEEAEEAEGGSNDFFAESNGEYTFDSSEEAGEYEDFDLDDLEITEADEDVDLAADFPVRPEAPEAPAAEQPAEEAESEPVEEEETDEEEAPAPSRRERKKPSFKLPNMPALKKKEKAPKAETAENVEGEENSEASEKPSRRRKQKSAFSKLLDMYMEPITRQSAEAEVLDPLDPRYVRRKKREKERIFKEVYLPAIIACAAIFLMLSFIVGSVANAITVKKNKDSTAKQEAQNQAVQANLDEIEFKRMVAQAEILAVGYDYEAAIELLESYKGDNDKFMQQITAKKAELVNEKSQLKEIKDTSTIPNLSFHVLMADASRACNKDNSGADMAGLYNKNFVSVEEFSRILNQLYSANYVLVDFDSFVSTRTGVDGNTSFFADSIYLPANKKPVMLTETMVNYFEYMVDPDKDGVLDGKGHGFANKLVVDEKGEIKAAYVDGSGETLIGNYDLVPILEAFIQEHPDFSYRGARAILAVSGTEGVFGYRTNTSYVSRFGQSFYDDQVAEAKKVVAALREKGYTIASYTYSNQNYRSMTTLQIQAEIQNWTNQITPVVGEVDTIVFARGGDIEAYSGTTFNVLYNSGLRFFLNSGSSPRVDTNTTFVRQTRLMVTGEAMAWYSSQFADYFDCNVVMDLTSRGSTPAKS